MPEITIIANPAAGGGSASRKIPALRSLVKSHHLDAEILLTEKRGHGIRLATQAALNGARTIAAAGGDGTVNEVINGIMQSHKQDPRVGAALGVLCIGRGNDFAGSNGIPEDLENGVTTLISGTPQAIDIGYVVGGLFPEGRYFGNCVGIGFDAMTTIQVAKLPRLGGFLSFFLAVLKTIFLYYKGPTVRVEFDGKNLTQATLLVSVMNGRRLGGGFWMAPRAHTNDGVFDLIIADQVSRRDIFRLIPYFMKGTHATQPEIKTAQAKQVKIQALEGGLPAQTDGEILCVDGKELDIRLLPQALQVIKPGENNLETQNGGDYAHS